MPKRLKMAIRIASPPGNTEARSGFNPGSSSLEIRSVPMHALRIFFIAGSVISPVDPGCARRMSAIALMVPDAPTATCHPTPRSCVSIERSSSPAAVSAARKCSASRRLLKSIRGCRSRSPCTCCAIEGFRILRR